MIFDTHAHYDDEAFEWDRKNWFQVWQHIAGGMARSSMSARYEHTKTTVP